MRAQYGCMHASIGVCRGICRYPSRSALETQHTDAFTRAVVHASCGESILQTQLVICARLLGCGCMHACIGVCTGICRYPRDRRSHTGAWIHTESSVACIGVGQIVDSALCEGVVVPRLGCMQLPWSRGGSRGYRDMLAPFPRMHTCMHWAPGEAPCREGAKRVGQRILRPNFARRLAKGSRMGREGAPLGFLAPNQVGVHSQAIFVDGL